MVFIFLDVEDFTAEMFPVTFQPGERKKCVSVNITNDEIVEQMEESFVFDIEVQLSPLNPTVSRSSSNITIIDDDSKFSAHCVCSFYLHNSLKPTCKVYLNVK